MQQLGDPFPQRERGTDDECSESREQSPEVRFSAVSERMSFVARARTATLGDEEKQVVAVVGERV
jgi:hypothetical protein